MDFFWFVLTVFAWWTIIRRTMAEPAITNIGKIGYGYKQMPHDKILADYAGTMALMKLMAKEQKFTMVSRVPWEEAPDEQHG